MKYGVWNSLESEWLRKFDSEAEAIAFKESYQNDNYSPSFAEKWLQVKEYNPNKVAARCVHCDHEVTEREMEENVITCCPKCGNKGLPVDPINDIEIKINWGELRILGIWAENWARHADEKEPRSGYNCVRTVHAICRRLQNQHPNQTPLTLAGEVREMQSLGFNVETSFDARENLPPQEGDR